MAEQAEPKEPADALAKLAELQESSVKEIASEAAGRLLRTGVAAQMAATEAVLAGVSQPRFLEICGGYWAVADRTYREMRERLETAERAAREEESVDRGAEVPR